MARRRAPELPPPQLDDADPWTDPGLLSAVRRRADQIRATRSDNAAGVADLALAERLDDYVNRVTGTGDWMQDKAMGGSRFGLPFFVTYMAALEIENRWRGSDLGARIVETKPAEMMREGWELSVQLNDDDDLDENADAFPALPGAVQPAAITASPTAPIAPVVPPPPPKPPMPEVDDTGTVIAEDIDAQMEQLDAAQVLLEALQFEVAYGGSAILIGADDGIADITKPLDEENIKSVNFLNTFQGGRDGEIVAWSYYRDPSEPNYGMPEIYMVRNLGVPLNQVGIPYKTPVAPGTKFVEPVFWVHESRLIIFPGTAVSHRARVQNRGWGDSVFTRVDTALQQYSQTWSGVANLMTDFKQDVLSVSGVAQKSAGDKISKGQPLLKRARAIQQSRSVTRMLVIDKDEETFAREVVSVAGLAEVLQQFSLRLAAAADMPVTLLMGQSPAGLSATGASDIRFFYDRIASVQRRILLPRVKKLIRLLFLASDGPTGGEEPSRWTVTMKSLYQLSAQEEAQRRLTIAQADQIYANLQAVTPEELAVSRFGGADYSAETTIDFAGRAQMAAQEAKERAAKLKASLQPPKVIASGSPPPPDPNPKEPVEASSIDSIDIRFDPAAVAAFRQYMEKTPLALAKETLGSGVNPITQMAAFFAVEMREPEHADLMRALLGGAPFTLEMMDRWISENRASLGDED